MKNRKDELTELAEHYKKVALVATSLLLEILEKTEDAGLLHQYPERFNIWYQSHKGEK